MKKTPPPLLRLNKFLSQRAGISRREADRLIAEGKLSVNGKKLSSGPHFVDPEKDTVCLKGRKIRAKKLKAKVLMFHKPLKVLSTVSDPKGRTTVMDYIKIRGKERFFPVGRLDWDSEGILLLSNDGEFADRVLHPRHKTFKSYVVKLKGELKSKDIEKLLYQGVSIPAASIPGADNRSNRGDRGNRGNNIQNRRSNQRSNKGQNRGSDKGSDSRSNRGLKKKALFVCRLASKKASSASSSAARKASPPPSSLPRSSSRSYPPSSYPSSYSWAKLILSEGQKRQVRWMFERLGFPVQRLKRVAIGRLKLSGLPRGSFRFLEEKEIGKIFQRPKELSFLPMEKN